MLIDHIAAVFARNDLMLYISMRFIGRIAAPVMFFFIAEGYSHTRNKNKYALRLAVFAAVSYLPFVWFMLIALPNGNGYYELNVIYTLLLGYLALRANREISELWIRVAVICLLMLLSIPGDVVQIVASSVLTIPLLGRLKTYRERFI